MRMRARGDRRRRTRAVDLHGGASRLLHLTARRFRRPFPALLWTRLNNRYVLLSLLVTCWMCGIGFLDDYLKLRQKREGKKNEGLVERYKLAGQVTIGAFLGWYLWQFPLSTLAGASTT